MWIWNKWIFITELIDDCISQSGSPIVDRLQSLSYLVPQSSSLNYTIIEKQMWLLLALKYSLCNVYKHKDLCCSEAVQVVQAV